MISGFRVIGFGMNDIRQSDASPAQADESDTPKPWGELSDAEKGALLLALFRGQEIQSYATGSWLPATPVWRNEVAYRVKPEPKRETRELWVTETGAVSRIAVMNAVEKISYDTIDGNEDIDTLTQELSELREKVTNALKEATKANESMIALLSSAKEMSAKLERIKVAVGGRNRKKAGV